MQSAFHFWYLYLQKHLQHPGSTSTESLVEMIKSWWDYFRKTCCFNLWNEQMQTNFVHQQLGWCQARLMESYLYVALCNRTVNLCFLSFRWYYTPSQSFRASVRSLTPVRKLCQKHFWQNLAECQEEGEGIVFPSAVKSGWIRKRVNVCVWWHLCFSWVIYEEKNYSGSLYVLSEGDYPNLSSMGCPSSFTVRSVKTVAVVRDRAHS